MQSLELAGLGWCFPTPSATLRAGSIAKRRDRMGDPFSCLLFPLKTRKPAIPGELFLSTSSLTIQGEILRQPCFGFFCLECAGWKISLPEGLDKNFNGSGLNADSSEHEDLLVKVCLHSWHDSTFDHVTRGLLTQTHIN
jgi:hypothetical protein